MIEDEYPFEEYPTESVALKDQAVEAGETEKSQDLIATLRSSRWEDEDLRRFALDKAVMLNIAGYGTTVLADAKDYYAFLKGA